MESLQTRTAVAEPQAGEDEPIVVFDHVSLSFDDTVVLRDVSFTLRRGHTKIILGASGAGKSISLKLILGLLKPDAGRIWVNGQRVDEHSEKQMMKVRADIGMVFQEGALFDSLTVAENVGYKLYEETEVPLDRGAQARRRGPRVREARVSSSIGGRPSFPVARGGAWPSREPWPSNLDSSCTTNRRPDSIRLHRRRSTKR